MNRTGKKHGRAVKILAFALAGTMLFMQPAQVQAAKSKSSSSSSATAAQKAADAANAKANAIEKEKEQAQSELSSLDSELVSLLADVDELQGEISDNQSDIEDTTEELAEAQKVVAKQYQDMKTRMKYMYENGDESVVSMLFESGSISDFLNRVEYANSLYSYDHNMLESYEANQQEIQDMKTNLEQTQAKLETEKKELAAKQTSLNNMITAKQGQVADFSTQLTAAKAEATKQAEAARKAKAIAAVAKVSTPSKSTTTSKSSTNSATSSDTSSASNGSTDVAGGNPSGSVSGGAVVSYAKQFVGNPYVWGGTSLTSGCDCSGFVQEVYKHFGVSFSSGRMTSGSFRSVGQAVSFDNIQPGDIVCYAGHVAIYAGGGVIVEAQSTRAGITCNRSVQCHDILAIRRI